MIVAAVAPANEPEMNRRPGVFLDDREKRKIDEIDIEIVLTAIYRCQEDVSIVHEQ